MERLAPLVVELRLRPPVRPGGRRFAFRAGQYAVVRLDIPGVPRLSRPLAIASPPEPGDTLSFIVGATDGWSLGVVDAASSFPGPDSRSPWMADVFGPRGRFTLEDGQPRGCQDGALVFLADGLGVAPFLSMARAMAYRRERRRTLLLWSARDRQGLACLDDLISLARADHAFSTVPILAHDPLWNGRRGTIDRDALAQLAGPELADPRSSFWVSAAAAPKAAILRSLRELGVPSRRIRHRGAPPLTGESP